jgi:hypothetical protein
VFCPAQTGHHQMTMEDEVEVGVEVVEAVEVAIVDVIP